MPSTRPEGVGFLADAPVRAVATREVAAPSEVVFDALCDAEGWQAWFPGMRRCTWRSRPPHGIGSRRRVVVGPLRVDERFVVWDRPHRWGFTFTATNLPLAAAGVEVVDLEPTDTGTRITYTMALEPPRLLSPALRLSRPVLQRTLSLGLRGLQRHLRDA